jgi:hypothetical protein
MSSGERLILAGRIEITEHVHRIEQRRIELFFLRGHKHASPQ